MKRLEYLPTGAEQKWLLENLAKLVGQRGYEPLVLHPIVEPTRRFFPEHRGDTLYVLDRTTRRLMQYAGLGQLLVQLEFFSDTQVREGVGVRPTRCASAAALFSGIDRGRCRFGVNMEQSGDAEHLVGVMCHEVAHAYRAQHGLNVPEEDEEELLTDLTTVYLGFGILSTNNSLRYRSHGELDGGAVSTTWGTSSTGYLPPQALSFLLAAQLAVRDASYMQRRAVLKHLETDQAAFTRTALRSLRRSCPDLQTILGIPGPAYRGLPREREQILGPLVPYEPMALEPDDPNPER